MSNNKSRTLTYTTLFNLGACSEYRERFNERYPSGTVEITVDLAVEQAGDWDWHWASGLILDQETWYTRRREAEEAYRQSLKPFNELLSAARLQAREDQEAEQARVQAENYPYGYTIAREAGYAKYDEVIAVPSAAVDAARTAAERKLHKAYAKVWAELYILEGEAVGGATFATNAPYQDEYDEDEDEPCTCSDCTGYGEEDEDY